MNMITPVSFNNVQSFQGSKVQKKQVQEPIKDNETSSKWHYPSKAAAAGMAILMSASIASCAKDIAKKSQVQPEPTTTYGQVMQEREEHESARAEYEAMVKESERAEMEEYFQQPEKDLQAEKEAFISSGEWGSVYDFASIGDKNNPEVKEAFSDIKNVLQRLGSQKVEEAIEAADKYEEISSNDFLTLIVQQGGVVKLSSSARQDVENRFGSTDSMSDVDLMAAYFAICMGRAEDDTSGAISKFSGTQGNFDMYLDIFRQLNDEEILGIADNDNLRVYNAANN